jgi:hypothetical protein
MVVKQEMKTIRKQRTRRKIHFAPCILFFFIYLIIAMQVVLVLMQMHSGGNDTTSVQKTQPKQQVQKETHHHLNLKTRRTAINLALAKLAGQRGLEPANPNEQFSFQGNITGQTFLRNQFPQSKITKCTPDLLNCRPDRQPLLAYNPLLRPRYVNGFKVEAQSSMQLSTQPTQIRIFQQEPKTAGKINIDPIELNYGRMEFKQSGHDGERYDCNVPCMKWGTNAGVSFPVFIYGEDWRFQHSMESGGYYSENMILKYSYKWNKFYATTSFKSEIPLPYYSWAEYKIQSPPVNYDESIKGASFIASNCSPNNGRGNVVEELTNMFRVDSLGQCQRNAKPPPGTQIADKKGMMQKYLLHLAFENTNEEDYITEKLWGTFESGTLPVYMGAPNVREHAPENSFISWHDFNSTKALGEYLIQVINNKTLYESYHAWRSKPMPEKFVNKYNFTHIHSVCRFCRWTYAKQRGLGWDPASQQFQELRLPRKLCLNDKQHIIHPFVESHAGYSSVAEAAAFDCPAIDSNQSLVTSIGPWQRQVSFHDGVIDVVLEGSATDAYRLTTPISVHPELIDYSYYQIQNGDTRITIVSDAPMEASIGVIDIRPNAQHTRLRIIVEDVDTFHEDGGNTPYHFAQLMIADFHQPMEFYVIET